jgi:hypothetical protein
MQVKRILDYIFVFQYFKLQNIKPRKRILTIAERRDIYKIEFGLQSKNLPCIIRGFKLALTVRTIKINSEFGWQARFYDHITRNPKSYYVISHLVIDNLRNVLMMN